MKNRSIRRISATVTLLLAAAASIAADGDSALPPEQRAGNIGYVTGGIDFGQSSAFQRARSRYPLAIELLQRIGNRNQFTADAQVRVIDGAGNAAFEAKAEGPYMLVRMPTGTYRVEATLNGQTLTSKAVQVGSRGSARAVLVFPESADIGEPAPQPVRNGGR